MKPVVDEELPPLTSTVSSLCMRDTPDPSSAPVAIVTRADKTIWVYATVH